jgi:hypothetical protein
MAAGGAVILLALLTWGLLSRRADEAGEPVIPGDIAPAITVEVLNATDTDGLARAAARRLRRRGIDVIYLGSAGERRNLDSTLILVRRGDSAAALAVRKALGLGRIAVESDPQRLLDASVLLGRDAARTLDRYP